MSDSFTRPENFAEIGPSLTAAIAVISLSDVASRLSHPGMHALRISGSLRALHTVFCGAAISRVSSFGSGPCPVPQKYTICPGFAADCLETLEEIADEGKETFLHAGGKTFNG